MVQVHALKTLNMSKLSFGRLFDAENAFANSGTIRLDYPHTRERDRFEGSFSQSGGGVGGTATKWLHVNYKKEKLYFIFSDMKLSAKSVLAAAKTKSLKDDHAVVEKLMSGKDDITGSRFGDKLLGYAGNDTIRGGAGIDTMDGGKGTHDLVDYHNTPTGVSMALDGSSYIWVDVDGVHSDRVRNFEDAAGGTGGDSLTGDKLANVLLGNAGADTLIGGGGNDKLVGDKGADSLEGGGGKDTLSGGDKADILNGGGGNDMLKGGGFGDSLDGGSGSDWLSGDKGNDLIAGGKGADTLLGSKGLDTLVGGTGGDEMTGGKDADTFVFLALKDSTTPAAGRDYITDFTHKLDKIDLSAIDAVSSTVDVNDAFVLDKKGNATSAVAEGHIGWYTVDGPGTADDRTFIRINGNADAAIDMTIELHGVLKLGAVDFIL